MRGAGTHAGVMTLQYKAIAPERLDAMRGQGADAYLHVRSATAQCFTFEVRPA